jgi:NitT/TauT family transport system substrate-binding protein
VGNVELPLAMSSYEHAADLTSGRLPVEGVSRRALDAFARRAHEQGVAHRHVEADELFPSRCVPCSGSDPPAKETIMWKPRRTTRAPGGWRLSAAAPPGAADLPANPGSRATRRRNRRLALAGAVAIIPAAALLAACGGSKGTADHSAAGNLVVGIPPVTDMANLYVADSKGFFASRGLTIKITKLNGGAALVPAMEAGSVDIGQSNIVSALQAQQQNLGIKCFAGGWRSPVKPQLSLVVSAKYTSSIRAPASLAGKTIAVQSLNNSNQLLTEEYLKAHGVNPASAHFIAIPYPEMPAALSAGRVAAAITDEPFTTIVTSQGSKILAAEPDQAIAPNVLYACWVGPSDWLSSHRQLAAKFVAALDQADSYMAAHPAYARSILPKYTTVSAELAGKVTLPEFTTQITAADVLPWARAAAEQKMTKSLIAPSSIITSISSSGGS